FGPIILEPINIYGIERFEESAVILRAGIKTRPTQQAAVVREFNRRVKRRFDELGIEIPFPHRTLYLGADKPGRVAPVLESLATALPPRGQASDESASPAPAPPRRRIS